MHQKFASQQQQIQHLQTQQLQQVQAHIFAKPEPIPPLSVNDSFTIIPPPVTALSEASPGLPMRKIDSNNL